MRLCSQLATEGVGVIVVMHDINLAARYATDTLILDRGRMVACGPVPEVLHAARIEAVWGLRCREMPGTRLPTDGSHPQRSFVFG